MFSNAFFWDRIANHYAQQPVADEVSYQKKLEQTRRYLRPDSRVLEFGCGTGSTAIFHAPKVSHITALDISSRMLDIAKEKAEASGVKNIHFEQNKLFDFDSSDESWDIVLGMSILHLLPDWPQHISRAFSLLKPGGVFISSTACIADMTTWFKLVAPVFRLLPFLPNVQVFSQEALREKFIESGFVIEDEWRPSMDKAVFLVARKPETSR